MSKTEATRAAFKAIPRERKLRKIERTFWGFGIAGCGIAAVKLFAAPYYVGLVVVTFGGVICSGEVVLHPFKLFFASLIDLFAKFQRAKNGQSDPEPPSGAGNG